MAELVSLIVPCYNEEQVLPVTAPMFLDKLSEKNYEMTPEENHALQMDFKTTKRLGIGVRQAAVYGFYKLT